MKLHSAFSRSRVVLSSTLIMALYATPVTYDFEHGQWQSQVAYAADSGSDDEGTASDDGVLPPSDYEVVPPSDYEVAPPSDYEVAPPVDDGTMPPSEDDE